MLVESLLQKQLDLQLLSATMAECWKGKREGPTTCYELPMSVVILLLSISKEGPSDIERKHLMTKHTCLLYTSDAADE